MWLGKKIPAVQKSPPPPPITFLMVRPLQSPESTPPTVSDIHDAQNHGTTEVRHNRPMKMKTNRTQFKCRYQLWDKR